MTTFALSTDVIAVPPEVTLWRLDDGNPRGIRAQLAAPFGQALTLGWSTSPEGQVLPATVEIDDDQAASWMTIVGVPADWRAAILDPVL